MPKESPWCGLQCKVRKVNLICCSHICSIDCRHLHRCSVLKENTPFYHVLYRRLTVMSLKYCPQTNTVIGIHKNPRLITASFIWSLFGWFTLCVSGRYDDFASIALLISSALLLIFVVMSLVKSFKSAPHKSELCSVPHYELFGTLFCTVSLFLSLSRYSSHEILQYLVLIFGCVLFFFAPILKLATISLYRQIYNQPQK